jgi:hypothetical protein
MNIILGRERAEELRERFTVLELDSIEHPDGKLIEAYCVVSAEKVPLNELPSLEQWIKLHESLVVEYRKGNRNFCTQAIEHLRGKFGGELDTFYDHILDVLE